MIKTDSALITGATGFVGNILVNTLRAQGRAVRRALRRPQKYALPGDTIVSDIGPDTDWSAALTGVDCVVHLAARVHMLQETTADALAAYRRINVDGTRRLARQAAAAGIRRFVFLSSIKVNGEATAGRAFAEIDEPAPEDAYGVSKREAEDVLRDISTHSGMEVVILRPPLVYGPGVKGNFLRLLRVIDHGLPLPLASVNNRRSLVHVANLVDAIVTCMDAPAATGQTFLVSDGEELSTPDLIRRLAAGMGRTARLLPCPVKLLEWSAGVCGQSAALSRLTGSLVINTSKLRQSLGWRPRIQLDQGLIDTARWYHQAKIQRPT